MPYVSCLMPYAALPPLRAWLAARVFSSVSICTFVLVKQVNYLCLPIVFRSSAWWSIMPACPQRVCMRYYATALRYYATALCTEILCYCTEILSYCSLRDEALCQLVRRESAWDIMLLHSDIMLLPSAWDIMLLLSALRYEATALCVMKHYASLSAKSLHERLYINYLINYIYIIYI